MNHNKKQDEKTIHTKIYFDVPACSNSVFLQHCVLGLSQVIRSKEETNVILNAKFVFKVQQSNKHYLLTSEVQLRMLQFIDQM
jgi:hypothetical protein